MVTKYFQTVRSLLPRLVLVFGIILMPLHFNPQSASANSLAISPIQEATGKAHLFFVPNEGQTNQAVVFQASSPNGALFFTANQVVIIIPQPASSAALPASLAEILSADSPQQTPSPAATESHLSAIHLIFDGANEMPHISGLDLQPGIVNYFIGKDPAKWHTGLHTYAGILYQGLYPGIDLRYETVGGTGGQPQALKGTYLVAPGTDPARIRWHYEGASVKLDDQGNLNITYPISSSGHPNGLKPSTSAQIKLVEQAPVSWQQIGQNKVPVTARYSISNDGIISFLLPEGYDRTQPLILDPTLVYSTFLGGSLEDNGSGVAKDSTGIYVSGLTFSTDFPITGTVIQVTNGGGADAYVTKLNPSGTALIYSTYLGGSGSDYGLGFAVDSSGDAYVTGLTDSTDFPTSSGAYDKTCGQVITCTVGIYDAFVTRLNQTGSSLVYSTFLGGDAIDIGYAIAVDNSGDAYVTGRTESTNFPTAGTPYQAANGGTSNGFVAEVDTDQSGAASLVYSTYLGGNNADRLNGIAIDSSGNAYVVGRSNSSNYPLTSTPFQSTNSGGIDVVVTELDDDGSDLIYSTYLGGSGDDLGLAIAIDSTNKIYITGRTNSSNFPTSSNAFDSTCGTDGTCNGGLLDAFIAKLDPAAAGAASRVYSTYYGGRGDDSGQGIAVDNSGTAYITGYTDSIDLPVQNAFQPTCGAGCESGFIDTFVARINTNGTGLVYSTYVGGSSSDYGIAISLDASGVPYVTGDTYSFDFPVVNPYSSVWKGNYDAFVVKIDNSANGADLSVTKTGSSTAVLQNHPLTYSITVTNSGPNPATGLRLLDTLPQGVSFTSATPSQGNCQFVYTYYYSAVSCNMGDVGSGTLATVKIDVVPYQAGTITNTVSVSSTLTDPNTANNTATAATFIAAYGLYMPVIRK